MTNTKNINSIDGIGIITNETQRRIAELLAINIDGLVDDIPVNPCPYAVDPFEGNEHLAVDEDNLPF